jgi:CheY-like chemotaxis protein
MHGGHITARSAGAGKGSQFIVRLPVAMEETERGRQARAQDHKQNSKRRILIVDDNRDSAESLALLLTLAGNETHVAYDGKQALALAERQRPDVILLDIGLPKLNGYDVCRSMRDQAWGKNCMIAAMTGWGQDEDRRKSSAAGFDAHLVKPVAPGDLFKLLSSD